MILWGSKTLRSAAYRGLRKLAEYLEHPRLTSMNTAE
jgi:hypothetical protein